MRRVATATLLSILLRYLTGFSLTKESQTFRGKIHKERVIVIIPITKDEAQRLNKEYGVKFGDYGVSSTHTKHKKFFLTENRTNLNALNEIRGVKTYKNKPNFRNKRVGV